MKPELVVHLIGRLQESADGASKGEGRNGVLAFVECLAANDGHVILTRLVFADGHKTNYCDWRAFLHRYYYFDAIAFCFDTLHE